VSVTPAEQERYLRLEGCFNFRDLGGYPTVDGHHTRWRRLFRADGLHRLTPADFDRLDEIGLATVIDLRTPEELTERGRFGRKEVSYHHLPMMDVLPPREDFPTWIDAETVAARYREMRRDGAESIVEVLAVLTDPAAYPAVFHCAAGRDRTGIVAALVLALLGVDDETVMADYALSRRAMVDMLAALRRDRPEVSQELERVAPAMLAVLPDAMGAFLTELRVEYGSVEGYVEALGVGTAIPHLRAALLE
jgi:protein-tyrosine phosphatase